MTKNSRIGSNTATVKAAKTAAIMGMMILGWFVTQFQM